ncbi:U-box domain-containing protein 44-like isoform X2 [Zingiber officinale]|uniref:U-box domain-containing protein 44-like isoform X2 n=1 Tax=Zingiber officinale TaxID=94328 RepID=UPI001C4D0B49|nr:U-box domain-containing protein 44-like isoform X2 [Zingiber officinale]
MPSLPKLSTELNIFAEIFFWANHLNPRSPETQLSMIAYLGELVLSNDVKVLVAQTAGSILVNVMKSGSKQARETALKALNQISSYETSAKILIHAGILPPLVRDLFTVPILRDPS